MNAKLKFIFSMAVFGTIAIFVKNIPLATGEIALFRAIIASAAIIFYKLLVGKKLLLSHLKKELPLLLLSGAAVAFSWIFLFEAYRYTTVSIAILSYYFAPIIVLMASPLLFREKLTVKHIVCFVMATVGQIMVIGVQGVDINSNHFLGIVFGLGSAVFYATVTILNKLIKTVTGIDRSLIQFLAAIIVLLPYVMLTSGFQVGSLDTFALLNLLILGLLHTGICYCLYLSSLKDLKGQEVAILSYLDALVAIVTSVAILGETISLMQIIGGMLIIGFTLLNEINFDQKRKESPNAANNNY